MTNNNNSISFDIVLGQIPVGDISSGSSNIPTGLALSGSGMALSVGMGTVKVDSITYELTEDITKYIDKIFEPGFGKGCRAWGEDLADGIWYVFAVSTGTSTDIFISQSTNPTFPTYEEDESCEYTAEAYKYQYGTRIGYIVVEDGVITAVYPEEDLASAYINHDLVTQSEFAAYKDQTDASLSGMAADIGDLDAQVDALSDEFDGLGIRMSELEANQESLESDMEDLVQTVADHTSALSDLDIRTTMAEGHIIALSGRVEDNESAIDDLNERMSHLEGPLVYYTEITESEE